MSRLSLVDENTWDEVTKGVAWPSLRHGGIISYNLVITQLRIEMGDLATAPLNLQTSRHAIALLRV